MTCYSLDDLIDLSIPSDVFFAKEMASPLITFCYGPLVQWEL